MQPLVEFLNHGALPFTGREAEKEKVMTFWRSTIDAQWIRAALLIGEAGVGKSRLIEEAIAGITAAGGLVVHAKLYPESATSLAPLIAREIGHAEATRRLLKNEPEPTLPAVIGALRRLSRLRPTLLVLEDIHLLSGESLVAFSSLLDALADEILSVLCAARPVEVEARGVVERYLVEEIELAGLSEGSMETLWRELFQAPPGSDLLEPLHEATRGNPLAIRSALRSALTSDMLTRDEATGIWRLNVSTGAFGRSISRNVGVLVEGMAAHLSDEEKRGAEQLACLGEVFARETAQELIADAPRLLDQLAFKGIIVTSRRSMPPLHGPASDYPTYAFTHTLLHQHFAQSAEVAPDRLVEVIARNLPLYSILPFQILARRTDATGASLDTLRHAVERAIEVSADLDTGPDWELAMEVWNAGSLLAESARERSGGEKMIDLQAMLLAGKIGLYRRRDRTEEYEALVDELLALTEGITGDEVIEHRLVALHYLHWREFRRNYGRCREIWEQVEALVDAHPALLEKSMYAEYLGEMAHAAAAMADADTLRLVERKLNEILASDAISPGTRATLQQRVGPHLLPMFDTAEELESRLRLLAELGASPIRLRPQFKVWKIALLESLGHLEEALKTCDDLLHQAMQLGLSNYVFQCSLVRTCAHAAFGADLEEVRAETKLLCTGTTEQDRARRLKYSGIYLTTVGLLRGESDWTRKIIEEFQVGEEDLWPEKHVILAEGNPRDALGAIPENDEIGGRLRAIVRFALGEHDASFDDALLAARTLLARPLLRLEDLLLFRAVAILAKEGSARDNSFAGALRDELRNDLMRALEWLAERSLVPYMEPLIDAHGDLLPKKELERWRSHLATVGRKRYDKKGGDRTHLRLSMLGTITVGEPGEEPQRIRGARLRTMLGLLVANRMLDKPLGHREFCQLAAGGELDPELARKTTNQAVLRLRESIGADTVVTGAETHELNLDRVRVDLLEADRLLREAIAAERERALIRAVPALMEALELTHGEVPFPGLYDDFFEALRSDFEHRLRSAVIGVARELLREGDPVSAERVLRGAFEAMPEDEELTDLLCDTLAALGERAEAERIRMRAREAQEA